jgi:hypothetical protein
LHLGFNNDDLNGVTYLTTSSIDCRHVTFVYDYLLIQQPIHIDGILKATTEASGICKGSLGQVTIGQTTGGNFE